MAIQSRATLKGYFQLRDKPTEQQFADLLDSVFLKNDDGSEVPLWVAPPATPTSAGVAGQQAYDGQYFYLCAATNTWVRTAMGTWTP